MIVYDFYCEPCSLHFDDIVDSSNVKTTPCPKCGKDAEKVFSAPKLGWLNNDPQKRAEVLKKRSQEHTIRELKREPEKFGFKAGDHRPWNVRNRKP